MRKIHGFWSKMLLPQTNSVSSVRCTLIPTFSFDSLPIPHVPCFEDAACQRGGDVRGHPILHFYHSKLCSAPPSIPNSTLNSKLVREHIVYWKPSGLESDVGVAKSETE